MKSRKENNPWFTVPGGRYLCLLFGVLILVVSASAVASESVSAENDSDMTHRMMQLVLQFGIILFAARFTGILFTRLKLPGVLGELFSGILLSAYALGGIAIPGFPFGVFPLYEGSPVSPELYGLATIASIVLLFDVGLETDLRMLIRYFVAGSLVGIGGIVASLGLGVGVCYWLAPSLGYVPSSLLDPMCLFLGIASTATSVGITARVLSEKKKLDSPEGVTILSAAVIDDVLGIILLAVVTGIAAVQGGGDTEPDWLRIGWIGFKALSVWLVATAVGIMASRRISALLRLTGERTSIGVMAFGLALVLAGLFEMAGLAMIIGAYVMGLSLSRSDIAQVIRDKMHTVYALLVPVFFCVIGMMIDVKVMTDPQVLWFAGIYTVAAALAKLLGCGLPALLADFNFRGALRVGFGMMPRGEVGLLIAALGLTGGILNDKMFAAVVIMVVINTIVAPPVLMALFRNAASGVRRETGSAVDWKQLAFHFGSFPLVELFISRLINVFESEGFYTSLLSRDDNLYEGRKGDVVIRFQQKGTDLDVFCREKNVRYVHTTIMDAVASVENTLQALRRPLPDLATVRTAMFDPEAPYGQTSKIGRFLKPQFCRLGLSAQQGADVICELMDFLCDTGQIPLHMKPDVTAAIMERENAMSTGLSGGLAIPHARVDCVKHLVCVIGITRVPIEFGALDGNPSEVFALTLSPRDKPTPHLEFISLITGAFRQCGLEAIRSAKTPEEVYRILTASQ